MRHVLTAVASGAVVLTLSACTSQEEKIRQVSFGFRALNLPKALENDVLALKNDLTSNETAKRQGKREDLTRVAVDRFMIEHDKAALELMNRFAEIWSYSIDQESMKVTAGNKGNKALQAKFAGLERQFDAAADECHGQATDHPKTLKEAHARCAKFQDIYAAVIKSPTTPTSVSNTQKEEEELMLTALHHNRDEVLAHMSSLGDFSWQKTPSGLLNLDCSIAIIERHNQRYPNTPWEVEGITLRNRIAGPPNKDRQVAADACMEPLMKEAEGN